ncbi:hypothetical protein DFJ73DRAFT_965633 [Zopfochytrium polystomum]|nr:hypothetical protein DFJ73DRAFT_965633 [Zopfochytrium polystomum]
MRVPSATVAARHAASAALLALVALSAATPTVADSSSDVVINGINVSSAVANLAPQTKSCIHTAVPAVDPAVPVTLANVQTLCAAVLDKTNPAAGEITTCTTANNAPVQDQMLVGLLPGLCASVPAPASTPSSSSAAVAPAAGSSSTRSSSSPSAASSLKASSAAASSPSSSSHSSSSASQPPSPSSPTTTTTAPPPPPPPPPTTTTPTPTPTPSSSSSLVVQGYNVTQLIQDLSPCSRDCLTSTVPDLALPVTWDQVPVMCPNADAQGKALAGCLAEDGCSGKERTYMALIPVLCRSLLAQYSSSKNAGSGKPSATGTTGGNGAGGAGVGQSTLAVSGARRGGGGGGRVAAAAVLVALGWCSFV